MPIRELIKVHKPSLTVHRRAFSTEFRLFPRDELQSVDRRYGHCANATLGVLYDRHGDIIEMSRRDGGRNGDLVVALDPPRVDPRVALRDRTFLPGKTLFLGHYMNLYGHFLVETMARFWGIGTAAFDHFAFLPFAAHKGEIMTYDFHRQFLAHAGITPDKIVTLRSPVEFEEIHVPQQLCTINHCANVELPTIYQDIARAWRNPTGKDWIFLSRRQAYHRVGNVADVEEIFRELDFEIVYPESLDLVSQIALYANCRVLAGFAGSALHNGLFCQPGTALIELGDTRSRSMPLSTQSVVNQAARLEAHFIAYEGSAGGHMDTENLRRALHDVSLLSRKGSPPAYSADFKSRSRANHYLWPATLTTHISYIGDANRVGSLLVDGLREGHNTIEGFAIGLDDDAPFGLEYRILQNDGAWTAWSAPGTFLGSRGVSKPIRGYAVRLTGPGAAGYRCVCLGKFTGLPGIVEAVDGEDCTAHGRAELLGLQLQLQLVGC